MFQMQTLSSVISLTNCYFKFKGAEEDKLKNFVLLDDFFSEKPAKGIFEENLSFSSLNSESPKA